MHHLVGRVLLVWQFCLTVRLRLTPHPGIFSKVIPMIETVMTFLGVLSASVFLAHAFEAYRTR
jgi:hypothetical protein